MNEYKNKSINACHDRRRFKNKIVRDNTLAGSPICSSLKQLDLARNAIRDGFSVLFHPDQLPDLYLWWVSHSATTGKLRINIIISAD